MTAKKMAATVSVEWGYDEHSITLTPEDWAKVKEGKKLTIRGDGYNYERNCFWDYWDFKGGLDGLLCVRYSDESDENDSGVGFTGSLYNAEIEEHEV
jgi:hypothetical protein